VDIEVRALLGQGGSLPEAMVELFLTCAIVSGVVAYGIRGDVGSRGQARARQRQHPRASPAPGEAKIAPEGEPHVRQGGDNTRGRAQHRARRRLRTRASPVSGEVEFCARGLVCFSIILGVLSGGCQAACVHSGMTVIMLLGLDATVVFLPLCSYAG
jgi:hypothetical protein